MTQRASSSWFVHSGRADAPLRLVCVPYAGGGASAFRTWSAHLPDVEVCAVQPPGRENRLKEAPIAHFATLIAGIAGALSALPAKPWVLFGHSLGALVAFELARALRGQGMHEPEALIVSGCRAPSWPRPSRASSALSDAALVERLRSYAGTPAAVLDEPELLALLLPTLRADFALVEGYVLAPLQPLSLPIIALGGCDDEDVSHASLAAWREHTTAAFALTRFAGGHFYLRSAGEPFFEALRRALPLLGARASDLRSLTQEKFDGFAQSE